MIALRLPRQLWLYSAGAAEIGLTPGSLREAFRQLQKLHPLVYERICTESGQPREHVNIFVNRQMVRDLDAPINLESSDVITILPAISGG